MNFDEITEDSEIDEELAQGQSCGVEKNEVLDARMIELCTLNLVWWHYYCGRGPHLPYRWPAANTLAILGFERALERHLASPLGSNTVNVQDHDGRPVLSYVAATRSESMAKFLLHHGADVHISDSESKTPLYHTACRGHSRLVELLMDNEPAAPEIDVRESPQTAQLRFDSGLLLAGDEYWCQRMLSSSSAQYVDRESGSTTCLRLVS